MLIARRLALSIGVVFLGLLAFFGSRLVTQQLAHGPTGSEHPQPLVIGLAKTPVPAPPSWPTPPPSAPQEATTSGSGYIYKESSGDTYIGGSSQESPAPTPEPPPSPPKTPAGSGGNSEVIEEGVVGG
jgi:hypothetical protein